jgi:hypothetical protein
MKKLKLIFEPGCFDNFDGTQEELDQLVEQITAMAENGELPIDVSDHLAEYVLLQFADSMQVELMMAEDEDDIVLPDERNKRLN